jgi:hypothetical protein
MEITGKGHSLPVCKRRRCGAAAPRAGHGKSDLGKGVYNEEKAGHAVKRWGEVRRNREYAQRPS